MPFTPRNDHTRRLADGLPGQNLAARIMQVALFWPHGLPEGRTGRQGYPGLRHARSEPRRVGQTIEATGAGKIAWRKRIGSPMEQPSRSASGPKSQNLRRGPISRNAKRGNHAEPNRTTMAHSYQRTCLPDALLLFLRLRPTPELRGAGGRNQGETGQSITPRPLERRVGRRTRKEWLALCFPLFALYYPAYTQHGANLSVG